MRQLNELDTRKNWVREPGNVVIARLKAVFGAFVAALDLLRCPASAFFSFPGRVMP